MKYIKSSFLAVIALGLFGCYPQTEESPSSPPSRVNIKTQEIISTDGFQELTYSGQLLSEDKSRLSFLVGGMIARMHVDEGQYVSKGTLLATLDPTDLENELLLSDAQLLQAEDTYNRFKMLYEKSSIPEKDFVQAKAGYLRAVASQKIIKKKIADTRLYAPFDGTIFTKMVRKGTVVGQGQPIYEIASLNELELIVFVPESEINHLTLGDKIEASINALNNKEISGKITSILKVADAQTRSYQVKAKIKNSSGLYKDGMLAEAKIRTERPKREMMVPGHSVIMGSNNIPYVFVYDSESQKALRKRIQIGKANGSAIEVTEGLNGSELIITAGQHQVRDGAIVSLTSNDSAKKISSN